ncbi:MAG: hypothetical protein R3B40_30520 [Polyangiales bacterium]
MDLKKLAFGLTLSASLFAGCGDDSGSTTSTTSTTGTTSTTSTTGTTTSTTNITQPDFGMCGDAGTAVLYRINQLTIPTPEDAENGLTVGQNVDQADSACGVPDYPGGVDNSLIDLVAALPALAPDDPIDLQAEIDTALSCAPDATDCSRLDLIVSVQTGTNCVVVEVLDGTGADAESLAGPFVGSLDGSGNMQGAVPSLALAIPYTTDNGAVDINLNVSNVLITGTLSETAVTNIVLGGALEKTAFETTIMNLLPLLGGDVEFSDISGILSNLYDVQLNGTCSALSVGLVASAAVVP